MNIYQLFEAQKKLNLIDAFRDFLPIAVKELNLKSLPHIHLDRSVEDAHVPTFGQFSNESKIITLNIANRHPVDILRTLAHELTHFAQGEQGELDDQSWHTGSDEENEANAVAGIIMREFNQKFPQYLKMPPLEIPQQQLEEGFLKNLALITGLAGMLASGPAAADTSSAIGQAIGIARQINKFKNYDEHAAREEAIQELRNLIRATGGQGGNYSKIYPYVKDMIEAPGNIPTDPNQIESGVTNLNQMYKKPVNEKWSKKYKRSINCSNPKGFSQRAHCAGRKT